MRIIIIGNGGSGKTWLARLLSENTNIKAVHLDDLFWETGSWDIKRPKHEVLRIINDEVTKEKWIVEGVYGELASLFLNRAMILIWLDIPWEICKQRIEKRSADSKMQMGRMETEDGLRQLIQWASEYETRTNMRSRIGHRKIFEDCILEKYRIVNDIELRDVINRITKGLTSR